MYYYMHRYAYCLRAGRVALLFSVAMLFIGSTGFAQTVRLFDDAPSIEQLRSILVPESKGGASRSIVIQRPGTSAQSAVKPASTGYDQPAPQPPASVVAEQPLTKANPTLGEPGAVAFKINFAFNSAEMPASARVMVDRIAQLMKEEPQVKLRIEGHTDAVGSADYNVSLSEQRAISVGQYLVTLGIAPERLKLIGKGKGEPLTRDPYDAANRRVQFVRTG